MYRSDSSNIREVPDIHEHDEVFFPFIVLGMASSVSVAGYPVSLFLYVVHYSLIVDFDVLDVVFLRVDAFNDIIMKMMLSYSRWCLTAPFLLFPFLHVVFRFDSFGRNGFDDWIQLLLLPS